MTPAWKNERRQQVRKLNLLEKRQEFLSRCFLDYPPANVQVEQEKQEDIS